MSADNGIYILVTHTPEGEKEYRVRHLQAVDNVDWDTTAGVYTNNDDIRIDNAREMWVDCPVFSRKEDAWKEACRLEKKVEYLEYGICFISIDRCFVPSTNEEGFMPVDIPWQLFHSHALCKPGTLVKFKDGEEVLIGHLAMPDFSRVDAVVSGAKVVWSREGDAS